MSEASTIGARYARSLAAKDRAGVLELLAPELDFKALTPRFTWEAKDPDGVLEIVFGSWFDDDDEIRELVAVETDEVAGRERVGYRLAIENPEGSFLVEQQAFIDEQDGRIAWMRVLCSGFRPTT
jgi:hypothetical protein